MAEILIKQNIMPDVTVYSIKDNDMRDFIAVKQDNTTIYLDKNKAVELQKAINLLK